MSFCEPCRGIIPWLLRCLQFWNEVWSEKAVEYNHHDRFSDLESASAIGCTLCQMLSKSFSKTQIEIRRGLEGRHNSRPFAFRLLMDDANHPVRFSYETGSPGFHVGLQIYSLLSERPIPLISCFRQHVKYSNPLDALRGHLFPQLVPCILNHQDCNSYLYLPTRLIDVGPPDGSVDPVLVESKKIQDSLNMYVRKMSVYATLSHCWGGAEYHVTTTTANITERMRTIPMSSLNRTFQDAIAIVRALNKEGLELRYIWIDSLCIIQDSKSDWEHESRLMSYVYSNSLVNIAAISAYNGSEGILHGRQAGVELPLAPGISSPDRESTNLWIRAISPIEGSALDSRAWVMQETILAPRTLYFGRNEASFQCRLLHCTETAGLTGVKEISYWNPKAKKNYFNQHQNFGELISDGLANLGDYEMAFTAWKRVAEVFSEKTLTFQTDKLPAIAGIARHVFDMAMRYADHKAGRLESMVKLSMSDELPDGPVASDTSWHVEARAKCKYYAGIWGGDLPSGICWHARIGVAGKKYRDYIAPSWSWASQDGPIDYLWKGFRGASLNEDYEDPFFFAEILNIKVDLASSNPFGAVSGGSLEIRGPWLKDLGTETENDHSGEEEGDKLEGIIFDEEHVTIEEEICGLVIGHYKERLGDSFYIFGLLLSSVDLAACLYKRIGFFASVVDAEELEVELKTITIQ